MIYVSFIDIQQIFEHSKYPEFQDVIVLKDQYCATSDQQQYFLHEIDDVFNPELISGHDFIRCLRMLDTTQSELFAKFPGIHYYTTCRPFKSTNGPFENTMTRQVSTGTKMQTFDDMATDRQLEEEKRQFDEEEELEKQRQHESQFKGLIPEEKLEEMRQNGERYRRLIEFNQQRRRRLAEEERDRALNT